MDLTGLLILGGFFAFMYAFIIRPQQKQQRERRELMASLAPGDDIVTVGGMHARIVAIDDDIVTLATGDTQFTFEKVAVGRRVGPDTDVFEPEGTDEA